MQDDLTVVMLNQVAAYHEAHADALMVHLGSSEQLTEHAEKLRLFFFSDAAARVNHTHPQHARSAIEGDKNFYDATTSEFERVLD